ncbi:MAG: hypothetical protein ACI9BK_002994 [Acidimicrobiales bacterium]|jgi:hypothetical protein
MEARVALPLFLLAFPGSDIDTDRVVWKRPLTVGGPQKLPTVARE